MKSDQPTSRWRQNLSIWVSRGRAVVQRRVGATSLDLCRAADEIDQARDALSAFGLSSDAEFTSLARQISSVNEQVGGLRRATGTLDDILQGRDGDRAIASAYSLYKNSIDLVHASIGIAGSEQEELLAVEAALTAVCEGQSGFRRNGLMFRMLAMGVRIEASRLEAQEQTTFFNVASAIGDIERQLAETTESAFGRIGDVLAEAATERDKLRELHNALHERAQTSIRTIHDELERVQAALGPCGQESQAFGAMLNQAGAQVARLTTALQYQDIVRQKLEHVGIGFEDIASHLRRVSSRGGGSPQDRAYLHQAAQLQRAQLGAARTEIASAGTTIAAGLSELAESTQGLATHCGRMHELAMAALRDCRVGPLFQEEIGKLSAIAGQSEENHRAIAQLVARIADVVNVFARDVGQHQFDVLLVALNAQVAAARLSSADALNKLAEEAIRLSSESSAVTQALASHLELALSQLENIKVEAGEFLELVRREKAALETGSREVGAKLRRLTDGIQREAHAVSANSDTFQSRVDSMSCELRFPQEIELCWGPAEEIAARLAAENIDASGAGLTPDAQARLDAHRQRYTMLAEHEAHAATVRSPDPSAEPALAAREGAASPAGEFGEGIELF